MSIPILIFIVLLVGILIGFQIGFIVGFSRVMRELARSLPHPDRRTIAPIVMAIGFLFLLGTLGVSLYTWHFENVAKRTTGTVTELRQAKDKDSETVSYAPTFRFQDADGAQHTVSSHLYSSPPQFHVGDEVKVLYRGDDPQEARIDNLWQMWGVSILPSIIGGLLLAIGLIVLNWPKMVARLKKRSSFAATG